MRTYLAFAIAVAIAPLFACKTTVTNNGSGGAGGQGGQGGLGGAGGHVTDDGLALATAFCDHRAACGDLQVVCTDEVGSMHCSAFMSPVDFKTCMSERLAHDHELFACVAPTTAQASALASCEADRKSQLCPTTVELDAYAKAIENGSHPAPLDQPPGTCGVIDDLTSACDAKQGCVVSSGSTASGGMSECSTDFICFSGKYTVDCTAMSGGPYTCSCLSPKGNVSSLPGECVYDGASANALCAWKLPPSAQ